MWAGKVLLLGDSGVGKSCLLRQFIDRRFVASALPTIGVEFVSSVIPSTDLRLQIWDTAGLPLFRPILHSYYRGTSVIVLVFDLTNRKTFAGLSQWIEDCREYCTLLVLVGNKCDQTLQRVVSHQEASVFATEHRLDGYYETSARDSDSVDTLFTAGVARPMLLHPQSLTLSAVGTTRRRCCA